MAISNKKKALIHVAKTKLGLSDDVYRSLLQQCSGYDSCGNKHFSNLHFESVMKMFRQLGFEDKYKMTPSQLSYIRRLEKQLGWDGQPWRLEGFAKRTCGSSDWPRFAITETSQLINGLLKMVRYNNDTERRFVRKNKQAEFGKRRKVTT